MNLSLAQRDSPCGCISVTCSPAAGLTRGRRPEERSGLSALVDAFPQGRSEMWAAGERPDLFVVDADVVRRNVDRLVVKPDRKLNSSEEAWPIRNCSESWTESPATRTSSASRSTPTSSRRSLRRCASSSTPRTPASSPSRSTAQTGDITVDARRRDDPAVGPGPHRRPDRQAGHDPAHPRGRARQHLRGVQGPRRARSSPARSPGSRAARMIVSLGRVEADHAPQRADPRRAAPGRRAHPGADPGRARHAQPA